MHDVCSEVLILGAPISQCLNSSGAFLIPERIVLCWECPFSNTWCLYEAFASYSTPTFNLDSGSDSDSPVWVCSGSMLPIANCVLLIAKIQMSRAGPGAVGRSEEWLRKGGRLECWPGLE